MSEKKRERAAPMGWGESSLAGSIVDGSMETSVPIASASASAEHSVSGAIRPRTTAVAKSISIVCNSSSTSIVTMMVGFSRSVLHSSAVIIPVINPSCSAGSANTDPTCTINKANTIGSVVINFSFLVMMFSLYLNSF
jgi:hypothetical protein